MIKADRRFKKLPHDEGFRLREQQFGAGAIYYKLVKDIKAIENRVLADVMAYYENTPGDRKSSLKSAKLHLVDENDRQNTNLTPSTRATISKDVQN